MPFLPLNQQRQSTEGKNETKMSDYETKIKTDVAKVKVIRNGRKAT